MFRSVDRTKSEYSFYNDPFSSRCNEKRTTPSDIIHATYDRSDIFREHDRNQPNELIKWTALESL